MLLVGGLLFVCAEIAVFVVVAAHTGFFSALALLFLASALGLLVVRHVGLSVLAQTRDRVAGGEMPSRELLDGLVVLVGAVLICVPGFIGDALGLLLMIRPLRRLVVRGAGRRVARRFPTVRVGGWWVTDVGPRAVLNDSSPGSGPALGPGRSPSGPSDEAGS
ncbi:MAG TPA: FxsA family protein [Acidimicrobiales bacterium]|nr:FxsA family protein [Acidimicrobiales bacterium]